MKANRLRLYGLILYGSGIGTIQDDLWFGALLIWIGSFLLCLEGEK